MAKKIDLVVRMFEEAIAGSYALSMERIQQLRDKSDKEIATLKTVFWVAIGLFNIVLWNPFSSPIPVGLRWLVGLGSVFVAFFFPILGIRRHRRILYQLEDSPRAPKRSKADKNGCAYIDKVKKQKRVFVRAEVELLEGEALD